MHQPSNVFIVPKYIELTVFKMISMIQNSLNLKSIATKNKSFDSLRQHHSSGGCSFETTIMAKCRVSRGSSDLDQNTIKNSPKRLEMMLMGLEIQTRGRRRPL